MPGNFPKISKALDVEMIRDGGSLAASFADESGGRHILITKIKIVDRDKLTKERIGYEPPLLIDCDPTKRPQNTVQKHYGELSGPTIPVTWTQARSLMALTNGLVQEVNEWRKKWLDYMNYVVANDGRVPPTMEAIMHVKRPPLMAKAHSDREASEYVRLGWTLKKEFKAEGNEQPYEYFFIWEQTAEPNYPSRDPTEWGSP